MLTFPYQNLPVSSIELNCSLQCQPSAICQLLHTKETQKHKKVNLLRNWGGPQNTYVLAWKTYMYVIVCIFKAVGPLVEFIAFLQGLVVCGLDLLEQIGWS